MLGVSSSFAFESHKNTFFESYLFCSQLQIRFGPLTAGARWDVKDRVSVLGGQNRRMRMCYFYPGQFAGDDNVSPYASPVSGCFCKTHAKAIQEDMKRCSIIQAASPQRLKPGDNQS